MASFKGISFAERGESGRNTPTWSVEAEPNIIAIGDRVIIQTSGQKSSTLNMPIRCTKAQLTSLSTAVDTKGTLSFSGGNRTAYLRAVSDPVEVKKDKDTYFATLQFVGL